MSDSLELYLNKYASKKTADAGGAAAGGAVYGPLGAAIGADKGSRLSSAVGSALGGGLGALGGWGLSALAWRLSRNPRLAMEIGIPAMTIGAIAGSMAGAGIAHQKSEAKNQSKV